MDMPVQEFIIIMLAIEVSIDFVHVCLVVCIALIDARSSLQVVRLVVFNIFHFQTFSVIRRTQSDK